MASTWDKTLNFRKGGNNIYKGQSMGIMSV
jgi:hypothetical protein